MPGDENSPFCALGAKAIAVARRVKRLRSLYILTIKLKRIVVLCWVNYYLIQSLCYVISKAILDLRALKFWMRRSSDSPCWVSVFFIGRRTDGIFTNFNFNFIVLSLSFMSKTSSLSLRIKRTQFLVFICF